MYVYIYNYYSDKNVIAFEVVVSVWLFFEHFDLTLIIVILRSTYCFILL